MAGCGAQVPARLKDEDVVCSAAGEGGEAGTHCSSGWLPVAGREGHLLRPASGESPAPLPG